MIRSALYITHEYGVDSNGTRTLRYRYTYDEANQITRVDDNIQSKTYVYQYDKGGNRVSEKVYNYTLSDSLGAVQQEIVSEYDNIVWDDLLTSYNGKAITYDNAGNPLTYDGQTYTWNGKQLTMIKAADGSKTIFSYDANGFRTKKTQYNADGTLSYYVEYIWSDGKIVSQFITLIMRGTIGNEYKVIPIGPIPSKIIYDDNGIPQGFTCGEANFGFVRNLQGDVIAMVDFEGNIVMEYSYDPWGNIEYHLNEEFTTEEEAMMITALCPLTYRGYNYDFTTGLYYLQSRYYNPEWGRFLNCDDTAILLSTQGETHNANLFTYCANNPVNRVDYEGYLQTEFESNDEMVAYMLIIFNCLYLLEQNGYHGLNNNEFYDFECSKSKEGILVCRLATKEDGFVDKQTQYITKYECVKIMVGTIPSWNKFESIDTLSSDEIWDMLDDSDDNLSNYYNEYLGVHSEYREELGLNEFANALIITGHIVNYSMYFPIMLFDQINYKNSYTYQWNEFCSYDGMYAISKKYTYMSKKQVANFMEDATIPKYKDIKFFGGLRNEE